MTGGNVSAYKLQTGKIVGVASESSWSQNHIFIPEDQKKKSTYGDLLVSFSLKAEQEGVDVTSFGKEIISRFHEVYYSSLEKQPLLRLKSALKSLIDEFSDRVKLEITAAAILTKDSQLIGYFALIDRGKILVYRNGQLASVLKEAEREVKTASGYLKNNDLFILGSAQFFEAVSLEKLKDDLSANEVTQLTESAATIIHSQKKNNRTAAVIFKIKKEEIEAVDKQEEKQSKEGTETLKPELEEEKKPKKIIEFIRQTSGFIKNTPLLIKKVCQDFRSQPSVFIKDQKRKVRAKKTTLSVAFILIALLLTSIILGSKKRSFLQESEKAKQVLEEANYKYDQALSLEEINRLRARSLLVEAKQLVSELEAETKDKNAKEELTEFLNKIKLRLEEIGREYQIDSAEIFLDLGLVKEEFKGEDWDSTEEALYIIDLEKNTVLEVEVETKAAKVAAGGERLENSLMLGAAGGRIFVVRENKLVVVDVQKGEAIEEKETDNWGKIKDIVGFAGNAYLLDVQKGQIFKYSQTDKGLTEAVDYLRGDSLDLEDAVSIAIDGSVWLLFNEGTIVKFTRGIKDPFTVSGLEKNFDGAEKLYTDKDLDNLYVLDKNNTRVVVINKDTGEYQAQYIWPGIAGAMDIFASETENKILLLTGERIYEIDLKL